MARIKLSDMEPAGFEKNLDSEGDQEAFLLDLQDHERNIKFCFYLSGKYAGRNPNKAKLVLVGRSWE